MRRAFPFVLFAAVTLAVFWKFLFLGRTIVETTLLESQLGLPARPESGWFPREHSRLLVADNLLLLVDHLRRYNEGLKAGELRLWNPSLCCGLPAYADPMLHPFYPPQLLCHALLPPLAAYEVFLLLHLFFSGAAMYWFLRGLGRSDLAGAAGGLVWMLLGYNSVWFSTGILAGTGVWGPLALLFLLQAFERRDPGRAALAGIASGLAVLGSHPQHALHLLVFTGGWLLVLGCRRGVDRAFFARSAVYFTTLSLGVGLAATLTRLDTIANGFRNPGADFDVFYGSPWTLPLHALDLIAGKASFFDNPLLDFEFTFYSGLGAAALAVAGAVRHWRDRRVRYFAIFALAALAVAFVKPLAAGLRGLPLFGLSPPSRWLYVFGLAAAVLVASGWDALKESAGRIPAVLAIAAAVSAAALLALFRNGSAVESAIGFALVAAAALLLGRSPRASASLGFLAILFELLPPFLQANRHADPALLAQTPPAVQTAREREKAPWRGTGALGGSGSAGPSPDWGAILSDHNSGNNLLALYGVENIAGFEAIMPESYVKYALAAGGSLSPGGRSVVFARLGSRLVDAMNLRAVFLPAGQPVPAGYRQIPGDFGTIRLYENPAALPRAWLVGRAIPARTEDEAARLLGAKDFDPAASVILETEENPPEGPGHVEGRVAFTRRSSDRTELQVSARTTAYLVLSENDYPGWEAELDGKPVPILRANVAFRAVALPPGDHAVVFSFRPDSARLGSIFSTAFLLLGIGVVVAHRRRRAA